MEQITKNNFDTFAETLRAYSKMFTILMRQRLWVLGVLGGTLSIATVFTWMTKPTYGSYMKLLLEPDYQNKKEINSGSQYVNYNFQIDYATQLNVMRSSLLLQQVVELLRPEYPNINVEQLKKSLVFVDRLKEEKVYSKVILVAYTDNDPIKTQKVLKALQTVYEVYSRKQQQQPSSNGFEFINRQLPNLQNDVEQSEAKLERFRQAQNLIEPGQQAAAIAEALNAIKQKQWANQTEYKDALAREIDLRQQMGRSTQDALTSSRLSQSARYQTLLNEYQKTELSLAQQRARFKDNNPKVQDLVERNRKQQDLLQSEVKRVLGDQAAGLKSTGENLLGQGQLSAIDLNLTTQLVAVQAKLRALKATEQSLAQTEQKLSKELNRFPALVSQYDQILPELQINRIQLEHLLKKRQNLNLQLAQQVFVLQLLEEPEQAVKISPNLKRNLLLGLIAGLILGSIAAFMREILVDAVHNPDELEEQFNLPLLGITPELSYAKDSEPIIKLPLGKPQLLAPWTVQVINLPSSWQALDLIYKNIQLHHCVSEFKSLLVTSALAGEGKSTLAIGLALSAARLNQRVLLIDADLRRPSLHEQLELPNEQGLSTLLTSDATVPNIGRIESSSAYIDILTAGPTPADPVNLLSSQRMRELLAAFEQNYDLVLLDSPPILGLVDGIISGSFCRGVILVVRMGKVNRTQLNQATAMVSKLNVVGAIANGVSTSA